MKYIKYLAAGSLMLAMTGCFDEPTGESTKHLPGEGGSEGGGDVPENIVSPTPSGAVKNEKITINTATTYQTMEGIGASDCWLGEFIGEYWSTNRADAANWLFSKRIVNGQPQGIGLSMWRVNLGGGSAEQGDASEIVNVTNRAECFLNANGSYNWNSCAGQRYFMQQAKNNGVEKFVLFSNSPLVNWTKNGLATKIDEPKNGHTNLKDDSYGAFAEYMATVAEHFIGEGYNISHISPANEPQYDWDGDNQEGSSWFNTEIAKLAREMQKSFDNHNISTNILLGEAGSYVSLYSGDNNRANVIDQMFTSGNEAYVGDLSRVDNLISGHSYWTYNTWDEMRNVRRQLADKAAQKGVRVWQTELSLLGNAPADLEGGYEKSTQLDLAMYVSRIIHNDFTVAQCTSWSYWTAFGVEAWGQMNRFELIFSTPVDGYYGSNWTTPGTLEANPNLWVLGNYSLYIRPGFKRVELALNESKDFFGTAWTDPDGKRVVMVITNYDKTNNISFDVYSQLGATPTAIHRYTTSENKNLYQEYFKVGDQLFVEPHSVTTFVFDF
ncbi:MAG: beta-glycosidase [Muribaculaceae bacterium]|nr:beta-glycosidase [Muribaculaceae bacterium]